MNVRRLDVFRIFLLVGLAATSLPAGAFLDELKEWFQGSPYPVVHSKYATVSHGTFYRLSWLDNDRIFFAGEPIASSSEVSSSRSLKATAHYAVANVPTSHVFLPPILGDSQEKKGLVWLDNQRVMFLGFVPGRPDSKGIYIWDIGKDIVSRYIDHTQFCYAEGYISTFGRSHVRGDRTAISPIRYGLLGEEQDGTCDTRAKMGCKGQLDMSCKPAEYARGLTRAGKRLGIALHLRSGDGALAYPLPERKRETPESWRSSRDVPLLLVNDRTGNGKPLPITVLEEVLSWRSGYSSFAHRYVLLTQRPKDGWFGRNIWPPGRRQPVYLMTSEGEVSVIEVPNQPQWTTVLLALPSVPGLVFKGGGGLAQHWGGVFLYDDREVSVLDRGKTETIAVSENGCGLAYAINNDYGKAPVTYPRVKVIDLCKGKN